jgi:hypothetical protein
VSHVRAGIVASPKGAKVHLQTSLVQAFVLFQNLVVQIITLTRFRVAPHCNQLAPLASRTPS